MNMLTEILSKKDHINLINGYIDFMYAEVIVIYCLSLKKLLQN